MKSLVLTCGLIVGALSISACVADSGDPESTESSEVREPGATDPAANTAVADEVQTPRELSFDNLPDGAKPQSCNVKIIYCRDPTFNAPTWCYTGTCSYTTAVPLARSLCKQICGASACSIIYNESCP